MVFDLFHVGPASLGIPVPSRSALLLPSVSAFDPKEAPTKIRLLMSSAGFLRAKCTSRKLSSHGSHQTNLSKFCCFFGPLVAGWSGSRPDCWQDRNASKCYLVKRVVWEGPRTPQKKLAELPPAICIRSLRLSGPLFKTTSFSSAAQAGAKALSRLIAANELCSTCRRLLRSRTLDMTVQSIHRVCC